MKIELLITGFCLIFCGGFLIVSSSYIQLKSAIELQEIYKGSAYFSHKLFDEEHKFRDKLGIAYINLTPVVTDEPSVIAAMNEYGLKQLWASHKKPDDSEEIIPLDLSKKALDEFKEAVRKAETENQQ